jgi:hypothetical protein
MTAWTDQDVETLKINWPSKSATQIRQMLTGRHSRNGVIGKAHRLHLGKKPKGFNAPHGANEQKHPSQRS